jgi:hypothetical protein
MKAKEIYTKKMALFGFIAAIEDDSIIDKLLSLVKPLESISELKDDTILKLSIEQKKAIDKGIKDISEGNIKPYKQAREELKKRMPTYFQ